MINNAEDLTEEQRDYLYNGVGSDDLGIYPPPYCFETPARFHDADTFIGNKEVDRLKADAKFFIRCVQEVHKRRIYQFLIPAVIYYIILLLGSWLIFEYASHKPNDWEELKARHDGILKSYDTVHRVKREVRRSWRKLVTLFNRL